MKNAGDEVQADVLGGLRGPLMTVLTTVLMSATLLASAGLLQGCAGVVLGAAAGTGMVAVDRRTAGAQVEDKAIEVKVGSRASELFGDRAHVSATSFNRMLLLTGEVANEADRLSMEQQARRLDNVKSVINDLAVALPSSLTARAGDGVITGKVKASFVDAGDLSSSAVKVTTERSIVYLMGLVTEREANRAVELARNISGVAKVVKAFEIISEAELERIRKDTVAR